MKLNKKGNQMMAWSLLLVMLILVVMAYIHVWSKTAKWTSKTGELQSEIIKSYDKGEKALIFIDQAAKFSGFSTIYLLGGNGGFFDEPECKHYLDNSTKYNLWEEINEPSCYPTKSDIRKSVNLFFNERFNDYAKKYTSTLIPTDNYDLSFNEKEGSIEIIGIATQNILIPPYPAKYKENFLPTLSEGEQECLSKEGYVPFFIGNSFVRCIECPKKASCGNYIDEVYCNMDPCNLGCKFDSGCTKKLGTQYTIRPSFKTMIDYNFIARFTEYSNKAQEIRDNIKSCLTKGSGKPDDDDLTTCSEADNENFEIKLITQPKDYTLLFSAEDDSFHNPYSDEILTIKFGIRFLDEFPPPKTEISGIEEKDGKKYLTWNKNDASDVISYDIYTKKIETGIGGAKTEKPTDINKMDKIATVDQTEWEITGLEKGSYYFYIIAMDNADNSAQSTNIEPIELPI